MKKVWLILSIVMAFMLLFACTADKPKSPEPETPTDPPEQGTPPAAEPINWMDNVPDSPYDTVQLVRHMSLTGYLPYGEEGTRTDDLSYSIYNNKFCDTLYYISTLEDDSVNITFTEQGDIEFEANFTGKDITDLLKIFVYTSFKNDGKRHLGMRNDDGTIIWLKDDAMFYFQNICYYRGLNEFNFLIGAEKGNCGYIHSVLFGGMYAPVLLRDIDRELTPEQAAEKLMRKYLESMSDYTPWSSFIITDIKDTRVELFGNGDILTNLDARVALRENQWIFYPRFSCVREGPSHEDGSIDHWFLEYESGWWRMYTRNWLYDPVVN